MSSPPAVYDFVDDGETDRRIVQGSTRQVTLQLVGSDVDFTGKACRAQFRRDFADLTGTDVLWSTAPLVVDPPSLKTIILTLNPSDTEAVNSATEGRWDCELYTEDDAVVEMIYAGVWEFFRETTRG